MKQSDYKLEDVKNFRKSLSAIVETCLEKYNHKSIWNFRNNVNNLVHYSNKSIKIIREAQYLVKKNPNLIDTIILEMNDWYTGKHKDSRESYDYNLVCIFTEEVTAIYVSLLGNSYSAAQRLKRYEKSLYSSVEKTNENVIIIED